MAAPPILEARGLAVRRGGRELVRVDRFAVAAGEVHVLLGPNAAGKTTLLRALNGLERADGDLLFEGEPVRGAGGRLRLRRHTAAVFQHAYLLSTTVRGNVESGLRLRGVKGAELRRRTDAALELLGIAHLGDRRRQGLSGGEAQRVSIARALAVDPVVLFLDEPMASLDPPTCRSLLADLQEIFRRLSTAVIWVTHDTEEALAIADRVTFLADSRVIQEGSTAEVFNRPAAPLVAEYLGIDVWLEGVVESNGTGTRLLLSSGASLVCPDVPVGPAFACIHPDDVVLFTTKPEEGTASLRNVLPATVRSLRPVGRSSLVTVDWSGYRLDALLTRAAREELDLRSGQHVFAAVKATAIRVVPRREGPGRQTEEQSG
jgi:tungstate transport system ATP-binding protein